MVATVGGNSLGLSLSTLATVGERASTGSALTGRNGELAYVNISNGNLVLQDQDELLLGRGGLSAETLRTYNSKGQITGETDNWSIGAEAQRLVLSGTYGTAASFVTLTGRDGAEAIYRYNSTLQVYVTTDGAGAHDRLVRGTDGQWTWTDGSTGREERYDGSTGRLSFARDRDGTTLSYDFDSATGRIKSVTTSSGEATHYDYEGDLLKRVRTVINTAEGPKTLTRVHYDYDTLRRLSLVTVDLTPEDNSITDTAKTYWTKYEYEGSTKLVSKVTQQDGTKLDFLYYSDGSVREVTDKLGNKTSFTYHPSYQTDVVGPMGVTTRFMHDNFKRLTRLSVSSGSSTWEYRTFGHNTAGDITSLSDGTGRSVTYEYDERGNQKLQRDAAGNTITRTFDLRNQVLTETLYAGADPDGGGAARPNGPMTTRYVYDAGLRNRLRFVITPEGRVTEHVYDDLGQRKATLVYTGELYPVAGLAPDYVPTEKAVNDYWAKPLRAKGQLVRTDMAYDHRGQLQRSILFNALSATGEGVPDGQESVTQYVYDQQGLLLQTIEPGDASTSRSTTFTYDGLGRVTSSTDARKVTTLTIYDDTLNQTRIQYDNGLVSTSTYDGAGRLVSVLQADATGLALGETKYDYDGAHRLRRVEDPTGRQRWMLYDAAGRKTADVDADGSLVEYVYDLGGRLSKTVAYTRRIATAALADLNTTIDTVRPARVHATDLVTWNVYDTAGRLFRTADASGAVTEFSYDGASRRTAVTRYHKQLATTLIEPPTHPAGVPISAIPRPDLSALDRTTRYSYDDDDGLLTKEVDAEGHVTEYEYDAAGRRTVTLRRGDATAPDIRSVTLYNSQGRVAANVDGENFLTEYVYDRNGNLHQQVRYHPALVGRIEPGTPLASIRPAPGPGREQQVTRWEHDELNRVKQMTDAQGTVTTYDYDRMGNLRTTTRAVGTDEVRAVNARFDLQGRLVGELSGEGSALLTGDLSTEQIEDIWVKHGLKHEYDEAGRRKSTLDRRVHDAGVQTLYFYDADGRLERTVNPLGEVEEWHYNDLNQLELNERHGPGTTDRASTRFTYDNQGLLDTRTVALEAAKSATTRFDYNAFGEETQRVTDLGDGRQRTDRTEYDRRGLQTITTMDEGGLAVRTESHFDAFGRRHTFIDGNGQSHVQKFDGLGRVVQTIDALGKARSTSYDAFDRVLTQTDALKHTTTYTYDTALRSVVVTTPENITVTTVRTRHGETFSIKDGEGHTTTYHYDHDGRLTDTDTPIAGIDTHQRFDRAGRLVKTIDGNDHEVHYEYDDANRVLFRRVDPAGLNLETGYKYDGLGRQVEVTDPNGTVTRIGFDLAGRVLTQTVDPDGLNLRTVYTRDAAGNVLTVEGPGGRFTQYVYDKLGRRIEEHVLADPAEPMLVTLYDHDDNGNVVGRTDPEGHHTRFAYDGENRLLFSVDATGGTTRHEYDDEGRLRRTTRYVEAIDVSTLPKPAAAADILPKALAVARPGKDMVDTRHHDKDGRLRFQADGTGAVVEFTYDDNGNVIERIAYAKAVDGWDGSKEPEVDREDPLNQRTRTDYDQLNRATHVADALGTVTERVYDNNGNLLASTLRARPITALQRPKDVTPDTELDRTDTFEYDKANRQTWHADATGSVTEHEYDDAGNVKRLTRYARQVTGDALPSSLREPGPVDRSTHYTYDKAGRRTHAVDAMNFVDEWTYKGDGTLLTHTRFDARLEAGQAPKDIERNELLDRTDRYVHDAAGRLTEHTDAAGATEKFGYDRVGNKTSFTDKLGHTWNYDYDAASRLQRQHSPGVDVTPVVGSDTTRLSVGEPERNVRIVTFMQYDALGRLTARTEAEGREGEERTTHYEYDAAGRQVSVTYPEVGVYDILLDAPDTGPDVARLEARRTLQSRTLYDTLGNAVANVDAAGHVSLKVYDPAGRVIGEIDALGHATRYLRNAFGEVETTVRHAAAIEPAGATPEERAAEAAALLEAHAATGLGSGRRLDMRYDAVGRVVSVKEPQAYNFTSGSSTSYASKLTTSEYDAFGDLRVTREGSDVEGVPAIATHHYYDALGRRRATVDAMGYVTTYRHDAAGNLASSTEFSTELNAGQWNVDTFDPPATDDEHDRTTSWTYDGMNRKRTETRHDVQYSEDAGGTTKTGDLVTEYHYDANGNLTQTIDPAGASVFTHYDALGRVTAVVAPQRRLADGTTTTPLTVFLRDAHGNAVAQLQPAAGGSGPTGYITSDKDRLTVSRFDELNREVQRTDAGGVNHFSSYNAQGLLGKTWQRVSNGDDDTQPMLTLFRGQAYDALGRITHTYDPAPFDETQRAGAGMVDTVHEYNAFGELTKKYVAGTPEAEREYYDYDAAGRLWRSNSAGGVDRIYLHDALGRQTAEIVSNGNVDLRTLVQDKAATTEGVRITKTQYDALGRATLQTLPARELEQKGVTVRPEVTGYEILSSEDFVKPESGEAESTPSWEGQNKLALTWNSLKSLGAGDVKVEIEYETKVVLKTAARSDAEGGTYGPTYYGTTQRSLTRIISSDEANDGTTLVWQDASRVPPGADGNDDISRHGIHTLKRLRVSKQDALGEWRQITDQTSFGAGGHTVSVALPEDPKATVKVEIQSPGAGWTEVTGINFGSALWFDARQVTLGSFDYRVTTNFPGIGEQVVASGTMTMTTPELSALPAPAYDPSAPGLLAWAATTPTVTPTATRTAASTTDGDTDGDTAGITQVFNYRAGSTGPWTSLPIVDRGFGGYGVETSWMPGGTYEYELLWIDEATGVPTAHATGTFTVTPTPGLPAFDGTGIALSHHSQTGDESVMTGLSWWSEPEHYDQVELLVREKGSTVWREAGPIVKHTNGSTSCNLVDTFGASEFDVRLFYRLDGRIVADGGTHVKFFDRRIGFHGQGSHYLEYSFPTPTSMSWRNWAYSRGHSGDLYIGAAGTALQRIPYSHASDPYSVSVEIGTLLQTPGIYQFFVTHTEPHDPIDGLPEHWSQVTVDTGLITVTESGELLLSGTTPRSFFEFAEPPFKLHEGRMSWASYPGEGLTPVFEVLDQATPSGPQWDTLPITVGADGRSYVDFMAWYTPRAASFGTSGPDFRVRYVDDQGATVAMETAGMDFRHTAIDIGTPNDPITFDPEPGGPSSYSTASTTDTTGPYALSLTDTNLGYLLHQEKARDGYSATQRPTLIQTYDRWGNVLTTNDPRNTAWKTEFAWNHNNQLIRQVRPNSDGGAEGGPVTQIYYDKLGRQVAVRDANGHLNGTQYDAAGQVVMEAHADGGYVTHGYDIFGRRVQTTDAQGNFEADEALAGKPIGDMGEGEPVSGDPAVAAARAAEIRSQHTRRFAYDKLDRLLTVNHGQAYVYRATSDVDDTVALNEGEPVDIVETFVYDEAGRQLKHINGNGEHTLYRYDLAGRIVHADQRGKATDKPGLITTYAYDAHGHKTRETNALGDTMRWSHDAFGRVTEHVDLGGATVTYDYDQAKQLVLQESTRGQRQAFSYDGAGQLLGIQQVVAATPTKDEAGNDVFVPTSTKTTRYAYDLAGNRVHERTEQDGVVAQDNYIAYDALGRMRHVFDGRVNLLMDYDLNGNRTVVTSSVRVLANAGDPSTDELHTSARYFTYDDMNRQELVDGEAGFVAGARSHVVKYDKNGNRISDTYIGHKVTINEIEVPVFSNDGLQEFTSGYSFDVKKNVEITETYRYDALNRLQSVVRDNVQVDYRQYDGAGRVVRSGTPEGLPPGYVSEINKDRALSDAIGLEKRISRYDDHGRLSYQNIFDGNAENQIKQGIEYVQVDKVGNVEQYRLHAPDMKPRTYTNELARYEGYVQSSAKVSDGGTTTTQYDLDGNLHSITDSVTGANNRSFITDAQGRVLLARRGEHVQRQLIVNGESLGDFGVGPDRENPLTPDQQPNLTSAADFSFGYQPISGNHPGPAPGVYTVRQGDSLQSIARAAYGDSQLWYRIADANGLTGDHDLRVGQTLSIPAGVGTIHNDFDTFEPYDPTRIVGDTTPSLPFHEGKCRGLSNVIGAIVTAVLMYFKIPPQYAAMAGDAARQVSYAMMNGEFDWKDFAKRAHPAMLGWQTDPKHPPGFKDVEYDYKATAIAGAAAWAGSAAGAAAGGAAGGASATAASSATSAWASQITQRAVSNLVGQGLNAALGRQQSFDWKGFVASALGVPRSAADLAGMVAGYATGYALNGGFSSAESSSGPGLTLSQDAVDNWGPQYGSGSSALGPDYRLGAGGVRFGSGSVDQISAIELQDFRQSERDYRSVTEDSVAGVGYRARAGDGISRIVGSSHPQAIGNFMRANGLTSDRIDVGRNYFVPSSATAYGDSTALGQFALNQGNQRIVALAARAQAASNAMMWGSNLSFDGDGSSFSALSANTTSIFEDTQSVRIGRGGRIEANFAFAGTGAQPVPMAAPDQTTSNFFGYTKAEMLGATQSAAVWGVRQGGVIGTATLWGSSTAGAAIDVMYPGSLTEASLSLAGGAVISKAAPATIGYLNTLPVLGAEVGPGLRAAGQWLASGIDDAAFRLQDNMGLVLRVVPDGSPSRPGASSPTTATTGSLGEPFQPSSPVGISDSHSVRTIEPNTRFGAGNRNTPKTIAMGDVDLHGDVSAINNGQGLLQADGQILTPSGRTYGTHPGSSTIYPTSGPGLVNLTQAEFQIYRQMLSSGGLQGNALRAFEGQMAAGNPGLSADSAGRLKQLFNSKGN